jgi:hypothetical protein
VKKSPKPKRSTRTLSIGSVTVSKTAVQGTPNTVTVTVKATGITVPYPPPANCQVVGATAFLDRLVGGIPYQDAVPQTMQGDIISGYYTTFSPRATGTFVGTVELNWMVSRKESRSSPPT